jgi:hypothetical protein
LFSGSERVAEPKGGIAAHEAFRIRMVGMAMKRIARYPNWRRGFEFPVGEAWWPELEARIEQEAEELKRQGRPLARVPEVFEVIAMVVFLLLAGRKAAWPLPVGAPLTFEAMGRLLVAERLADQTVGRAKCDQVDEEEIWGVVRWLV